MVTRPPPPPPHTATPYKGAVSLTCKIVNGYKLPMASEYVPAWGEVLRTCGYPLTVVVIDFESYFDSSYGLKALSIPECITDKRWEVLGVACTTMHAEYPFADYEHSTRFHIGEEETALQLKYLQTSYGPNLERCTVVMQNAPFDASVLALRYNLHPKYIIDTACLARAWHTRSKHGLKDLCTKFGLPEKGETKDFMGCTFRKGRYLMPVGRGKHRKPPQPRPLMTENQAEALAAYACNDAAREWELLTILLPRLSNPKTELQIMDSTLRMFTQPALMCDNARGIDLIARMQQKMTEVVPEGMTPDEITGNNSFDALLTNALQAAGDNPMSYTKFMKSGVKYELAKDDPGLKRLQQHPDAKVRGLISARSALKSWPLHVSRIESIMAMAKAHNGYMPVPLTYHGGHTGRDSGGQGINLQNLPKRGPEEVVALRGLLIAPPNHELAIVDLSGVEARVLAWVAGQWDLVDAFKAGTEIYCGFAEKVLGVRVRKPTKAGKPGYIKAIENKHTENRNFGKVGILGCGYGMGKDRLQEYAAGPGFDLTLTQEQAKAVVDTYRSSYPAITGFWRAIEKAFLYTAKYKKPCAMERGISFHSTDAVDVVMTLPNGRRMNYHRVKLEAGQYQETVSVYNEITHTHDHLWGGVLTENLVQAISRDLMMEAMLRLPYRTVHRVHDELILLVPKGRGEQAKKDAEKELSREPVWAPRLALGAEGSVAERYGLH